MTIYMDDSKLSLRLKSKLVELDIQFNSDFQPDDVIIYIGQYKNIPRNLKICKLILEIEDPKELDEQFPMNTLCYSQDVSDADLHLLAKRLTSFHTESADILDQFSVMVHDIYGDINHVSCYAQLCLLDCEDKEVIDNCTIVVSAASKVEKKIEDLRKRSLGFIFTKEYQALYNMD